MESSKNFCYLTDQPETEDRFLWKRLTALSQQLAVQIPRLPLTSPVLISGDWGSGKTTLLRQIKKRLAEKSDTPTVWFEAWRYEGESLLLPALMRAIWKAAERAGHSPAEELKGRVWKAAVAVAAGIGPMLAKAFGGPAPVLLQGLLTLLQEEREVAASRPSYLEDSTEDLWEEFRRLLGVWGSGKTVVVFIDDLDRCNPEGAIGLLDALRMLINQTATAPVGGQSEPLNCRFVVALDRGVLAVSVEE